MSDLKAPFPYFGGKRQVAALVWSRLGDVRNYIEPFCGSAAMLWLRPHTPRIETINDFDCHVANFWRAVQHDPAAVARHCNWPVNEADLHARHRWLVYGDDAAGFRGRMRMDPEYFDARIAGWWCWGLCMWIGGGWCADRSVDNRRPGLSDGASYCGIHNVVGPKQQMPDVSGHSHGRGVHKKRPSLGDGNGGASTKGAHRRLPEQIPDISGDAGASGRGVHRKLPDISGKDGGSGRGVHQASGGRPQLADAFSRGRGVHGNDTVEACAQREKWLVAWFGELADRLRTVRVCCGDWKRVCGSCSVTTRLGVTGVFLDPPYSAEAGRDGELYAAEDLEVAHQVRAWCVKHSPDTQMRIALCGYVGEHDELEQLGWDVVAWKAHGGYGNRGEENTNRAKERIWFSPACETARQGTLF